MKNIERLRKVVNMAIKNDCLDRDPFQKFQPVFTKSNREFLTADELAAIEQTEFKILRLQHAKVIEQKVSDDMRNLRIKMQCPENKYKTNISNLK